MIKFDEIEMLARGFRDMACSRRLHEEVVPKQISNKTAHCVFMEINSPKRGHEKYRSNCF